MFRLSARPPLQLVCVRDVHQGGRGSGGAVLPAAAAAAPVQPSPAQTGRLFRRGEEGRRNSVSAFQEADLFHLSLVVFAPSATYYASILRLNSYKIAE